MTSPNGRVEITRQIGIDMGHRVTNHASKCRNVHGHRYLIEATATTLSLVKQGAEQGMVTDFGVLKDAMMDCIDVNFDHALCLWYKDPLATQWFGVSVTRPKYRLRVTQGLNVGKVVLLDVVPTAEHLAHVWYTMVDATVRKLTAGKVWLTKVRVWETPNCYADYIPPSHITRKYGKRA
jgi:6-pyruvoyltetrahydropterin/6-carboxytetrahydropterin synthase